MNKMLFLLAILSVPGLIVAEKEQEETKASSPFDAIKTKDFPYYWRYLDDIGKCAPASEYGRTSLAELQPSLVQVAKLVQCTECKKLAEKKFDTAELDEIMKVCQKLMIKEPARDLWSVAVDSEVQAMHDKAMALYNCARICRDRAEMFTLKEKLNELLSQKGKATTHAEK